MDRYPANSSAAGQTLRKTFLTSDPAFALPVWARTGKCFIRVTGVGAGASGAVTNTNSGMGEGGGAGALAVDMPMIIPAGTTSIAVTIGVGGNPATGANVAGNQGGNTTLKVGSTTLLLKGGNVGTNQLPAIPCMLDTAGEALELSQTQSVALTVMANCYLGATGKGRGSDIGSGAGGPSPYGAAGKGLTEAIGTTNINGTDAQGHGAGGSGATSYASNAVSGRGAPGLLMIEIVEAI